MDVLSAIFLTGAIAIIAARALEIASRRPQIFAEMFQSARRFAESALEESAAMRARSAQVTPVGEPAQPLRERPALAA